ncbi:MAG: hypothetical protein ACKVQW_10170 [Pyrinomonadaceae bacterium]
MRYCPKCRSFYDDAQLRFCLRDGVPLVDVSPSDQVWNEGTSFIRETQRRVTSETRIRQLKKIVSILITTVMVIMVVSVITLNSWIYLSEPESEVAENVTPSPASSPEASPEPSLSISPEPTVEPTPTSSPTPTPTRTRTQTPTPTPRPTITIAPPVCNTTNEAAAIRRNYGSYFFEQIKATQPSLSKQYMNQERQAVMVSVALNEFNVSVSPDCRSATIGHPYQAILINRNGRRSQIPLSKGFSCTRGASWTCR